MLKFRIIDINKARENDYAVYDDGIRRRLSVDDIDHMHKYGCPEGFRPYDVDHYERMQPEPKPGIFKHAGNYYIWDGEDAAMIATCPEGVATTKPGPLTSETIIAKCYDQIIELPDIQESNV